MNENNRCLGEHVYLFDVSALYSDIFQKYTVPVIGKDDTHPNGYRLLQILAPTSIPESLLQLWTENKSVPSVDPILRRVKYGKKTVYTERKSMPSYAADS